MKGAGTYALGAMKPDLEAMEARVGKRMGSRPQGRATGWAAGRAQKHQAMKSLKPPKIQKMRPGRVTGWV